MSERVGVRWAAALVVLLLLGGAALVAGGVFESDDQEGGPDPDLLTAEPRDPELATGGRKPDEPLEAGEKDGGAKPPEDEPGTGAVTSGEAENDGDTAVVPGTGGEEPGSAAKPKPAVRRSPYGLPKRKPGTRFGGGGPGPGGPTGHWTRFGRFPRPKGTARIAVTVLDEDGRPFPGADVYLGPPDTAGSQAISFGDLRKLGTTGPDGVLAADGLPDGAAAVFGNYRNMLNGRYGLDGSHGVVTTLRPGQGTAATVKLPFPVGEFGAVAGKVVGPEGRPLPASVAIGYSRMWAKKDGLFSLAGVTEGTRTLAVRSTGYRPHARSVEVVAGKTTQVEVKLEYAEAGTMRIEGTVVGPQDEPVAGANVYLMMTKERGTLRRAITDAQGRFAMEQLPERVRTEASRLQASRVPQYASHVLPFEAGIADERVTLKLPIRYVQFELRVLDAATGEPIRQLNVVAERPESKRPRANLTYDYAQGYRRGMVEPGRHTVRIDALDHEDVEFDVDVKPDADGRFVHEVRLTRVSPPSVEVALTVRLTDAASGAFVTRARIEVLEADGSQALSRFEGRRTEGEYRMPAPSGKRRLAIAADGYEPYEAPIDLKPDEPEVEVTIQLRPR
jgi:hypothetical protein